LLPSWAYLDFGEEDINLSPKEIFQKKKKKKKKRRKKKKRVVGDTQIIVVSWARSPQKHRPIN
jgi:hypothetical protein